MFDECLGGNEAECARKTYLTKAGKLVAADIASDSLQSVLPQAAIAVRAKQDVYKAVI